MLFCNGRGNKSKNDKSRKTHISMAHGIKILLNGHDHTGASEGSLLLRRRHPGGPVERRVTKPGPASLAPIRLPKHAGIGWLAMASRHSLCDSASAGEGRGRNSMLKKFKELTEKEILAIAI